MQPALNQPVPLAPPARTNPQSPDIITLDRVSKRFGSTYAVQDVSWQVQPGEIFGIVGPSGCGKTTTIRMMTGVYTPTTGTVSVLGQAPAEFRPRDRERIGYIPQLFVLYPNLTVAENMRFSASMYGMPYRGRMKRIRELLEFVELSDAERKLAENLSGGMQRRLQLAAALIHNPELLFADEPTAGIDPVLRGRFWDQFKELKTEGRSLVVTTQYVSEVAYCDRVAVMRAGELLLVDTPEGLRRQALGGDVISLRVDPEDTMNALQLLSRHPLVRDVHRIRDQAPGSLAVYVERSGEALPEIIQALGSDTTIDTRHVEEYKPPFDEIFITLMERADRERPRATGASSND
ncbi:MAG: ABC transporter ATP-binding protein [Herpetosiphonaceae bacterium]|nr:ABC transporter ATP-binding protein [Herpetosiphonaceae bacterium]